MARRSLLLASDADRERVADRLRQAATEGRILAHELEERVATALRARTYGELDALVADLPRADAAPRRRGSRSMAMARKHPVGAVAVLVVMTLMMFVIAAVILAGLFAFSGIWVMLAVLVFARRAGRAQYYGPRRYSGGRPRTYGGTRPRYTHWIP